MVSFFQAIINLLQEHVRRGHQIAIIQVERGTDPLTKYSRYTHYIAQGFIFEDPQMSSEDALDKAIQFTNRRIDAFIFSDNLEDRNWARNMKQFRDDYRKINARNATELNKIQELILLENYNIELYDKINIHKNVSVDQKIKKIFGCSDFQKMCRNNQKIDRLRTDLNIN